MDNLPESSELAATPAVHVLPDEPSPAADEHVFPYFVLRHSTSLERAAVPAALAITLAYRLMMRVPWPG